MAALLLQMQLRKLLPSLLLIMLPSLLCCCSHAKSCTDASNLGLPNGNLVWKTVSYDRVNQGYLFRTDTGELLLDTQTAVPQTSTLSSYTNDDASSNSPGLYIPWGLIFNGGKFRLSFTMSVNRSSHSSSGSSLVLAILPAYDYASNVNHPMGIQLEPGSWSLNSSAGSSSQMGPCRWPVYRVDSTACVQIPIEPTSTSAVVESSIVYDPLGRRLSVSVGDAAREPDAPYALSTSMVLDLSSTSMLADDRKAQFGLFASVGQLARLQTWNLTVDLPVPKEGLQSWAIVLSSVLGSVAATVVVALAVCWYLNSKHRRWKKDMDQLGKIMRRLPGVPTQVDFAEIRKATSNFNETTKLGRGGFGAVYGCTLPAGASRTGQPMRVAVKKFTRELTDRRYEDFLAEVSIINRLRHKNVVPLIGWSYNKGEPLLIYEYMKNGSLDQHLFQSGGKRQQDTSIGHWGTRYGIAKGIATGLHYLHDEHEPVVLHRDIKASNVMLDSAFCARLGDFGIACTVDAERGSVTGFAGTFGYIGPEFVMNYKATRQTDVYSFGVVVLEIVTGKKNTDVPRHDAHITQWVRRLHREGRLLEALDDTLVVVPGDDDDDNRQKDVIEEARRLLLVGLACTNPNPSTRPTMAEVLQVINKLAPPPDVSLEPPKLLWMPEEWSANSISSE